MCAQTSSDSLTTRKRTLLTIKTKLQVIKKFDSGVKVGQISKEFNLASSTVSSIIRDKKRILAACKSESVLNSSTIIRKHHGIIAKMESILKTWCEQQTEQNLPLSRLHVCLQAIVIFEGLRKDYGEAAKFVKFSASKGWYARFKRRCLDNDIMAAQEEENVQEEMPATTVTVKNDIQNATALTFESIEFNVQPKFPDQLKDIIREGGYNSQTIFNVDEVSVYWKKMPGTCPLACHNQTIHGFNETKDRFTVLLGGNASGDLKLKPLMIYRAENPKALLNKSKGGLPVLWKSNPKANMTASIFEDWLGHHFIPEVERYCYENNIPFKILLVIDNAEYHPPTTLVDFDKRVNVVFLPPGEAGSIQPISQEISDIFRADYTRRMFKHLLDLSRHNDIITTEELWKDYNILDAIRIVTDCWFEISENDWYHSWRKLCPFITNTEFVESNTVKELIDEIMSIASELDMKIDGKDILELLESQNKEPTIEDLIEMQEYSANEEMEIQDPLIAEDVMAVESLTEAFSHIKMGLQILENIDVNEQRARTTKLGVMKLLAVYEEILKEKIRPRAQED